MQSREDILTKAIPLNCTQIKKLKRGRVVTARISAGPIAREKRVVFTTTANINGVEQEIEIQADRARCFGNGSAEFKLHRRIGMHA